MRAMVLAGGKGTRLAAAVPDRPKILAPVNGRPFLEILVSELRRRGIDELLFLLGDRHEQVVPALAALGAEWSIEHAPLGTAGAVKLAAARACEGEFFLVNGDTYLDFDADGLRSAHLRTGAAVTIAAARVDDVSRYGSLDLDGDRLRGFREKAASASSPEKAASAASGLINGGVYVVAPRVLERIDDGRFVSLENEIFPRLLAEGERVTVVEQRGAFFDIGTESSWRSFARWCGENGK